MMAQAVRQVSGQLENNKIRVDTAQWNDWINKMKQSSRDWNEASWISTTRHIFTRNKNRAGYESKRTLTAKL
jgi:hypothetical protein